MGLADPAIKILAVVANEPRSAGIAKLATPGQGASGGFTDR